jgi:putative SOS response-associated peptidase YedK
VVAVRWALSAGLPPSRPALFQARDDKLAVSNARKPLARTASHRRLMVADGWIEWQRPEDPKQTKQPFLHRLKDGELFAFAGLWTVAQPKDADEPIASCAVVTTRANRDVAFVNHRMPVVLDGPDAERAWLNPDVDLDAAVELAAPLADGRLDVYPISSRINSSRNEGLDLLERVEPA